MPKNYSSASNPCLVKERFTKLVFDKRRVDGNSCLEKGELNVNSWLVKDEFILLVPSKRRVYDKLLPSKKQVCKPIPRKGKLYSCLSVNT